MGVRKAHRNASRWVHNRIWSDKDQTLCSRAYYSQFTDWRWFAFRLLADTLFWVWERQHCRRSNERYW